MHARAKKTMQTGQIAKIESMRKILGPCKTAVEVEVELAVEVEQKTLRPLLGH